MIASPQVGDIYKNAVATEVSKGSALMMNNVSRMQPHAGEAAKTNFQIQLRAHVEQKLYLKLGIFIPSDSFSSLLGTSRSRTPMGRICLGLLRFLLGLLGILPEEYHALDDLSRAELTRPVSIEFHKELVHLCGRTVLSHDADVAQILPKLHLRLCKNVSRARELSTRVHREDTACELREDAAMRAPVHSMHIPNRQQGGSLSRAHNLPVAILVHLLKDVFLLLAGFEVFVQRVAKLGRERVKGAHHLLKLLRLCTTRGYEFQQPLKGQQQRFLVSFL